MLEFKQLDGIKEIKVEPIDKAVGIGTRDKIEDFLHNRYIETYYNLDKPSMIDIEIKENAFDYHDKDACRTTINETKYSLPFIYQIIEHIRGTKMITKEEKPYKRAIGQIYGMSIVIPDKKGMPILITNDDTENWYVLAPILEDD